ncbi:MAG TPA: hypothetical protein VJ801_10215 [Polyangia bacterium]|jgi:hypothetical protein|nr:hypothetical protein [Polyangia bacterium]
MPQKSPLSLVNDAFGAKDKLVDKLVTLLDRGEEPKADLRKRLLAAANSKLLNLHRVATAVKEKFGSRDKLVAQAASLLGHSKDKDFVARLDNQSNARLLDLVIAAERKAKRAAAKPKTKPAA